MSYGIPWGGWSIRETDWGFIKSIIKSRGIRTVLEFGTGLSTLLLSELAEIDTFETESRWSELIKAKVPPGRKVTFYMWGGKTPPGTEWRRRKYDLAFVDGPRGKASGGIGREMSMHIAAKFADRIIVHDAGREDETELQEQILEPKFDLIMRSDESYTRCHYWERKSTLI